MLGDVDTWVLDLDNTLYPADSALAAQLTHGILSTVAGFYGTDLVGARRIQAELVASHGTSLRGAMLTRGIDPHEFLAFERRMDYSVLRPDPVLAAAVGALPGRRYVYTNGSAYHAEAALSRLGLTGCIDGVFDIISGELIPKPHAESLDAFLALFGVDPRRAIMIDDLEVNLELPRARGMTTALMTRRPETSDGSFVQLGEQRWQVWDLAAFLQAVRPDI